MITPTPWQARVIDYKERINLAVFGGRGAGRTTCALIMATKHCDKWGHGARVLFIRQTLRSLREVEDNFQLMLARLYPGGLRVNRQDHIFILPNNSTIEFSPLNDVEDMAKLQGRSFTLIIADEYGNFSPQQMKFVDQLRANLRPGGAIDSGLPIPTRFILLANPGGRGHSSIKTRFIDKMIPWRPTTLDADVTRGDPGTEWALCPASFTENPHLPASYSSDLFAAAQKDKELYRAWAKGEWNIARGAMFGDCIDEEVHKIDGRLFPWGKEAVADGEVWVRNPALYGFTSTDWGQSSPAVSFACWKFLRTIGPYHRGSVVIVDEVSSADPDDWSVGLNWSIGRLGDSMRDMCDRTGVYRVGTIDDAKGLQPDDTLIKQMQGQEFSLIRPKKNRRSGWATVREMLVNATAKPGDKNYGKPGLWIAGRCQGWWATVPIMPRDPLNPEDVDTRSVDHWGDTTRYAVVYEVGEVKYNTPDETLRKYGIGGPTAPRLA